MRDLLVTVSAAVLSFVLLAAGVLVVLNFTRGGQFDRDTHVLSQDYASTKATYGDPWQLMSRTTRLYDYGVIPLVSVIAGGLVGFLAKRRRGLLGCLSVVPLAVLMLAAHSFAFRAFLLVALYLILAWTVASTVSRLLKRTRTSIPTARTAT
jgi:hypothetical protein